MFQVWISARSLRSAITIHSLTSGAGTGDNTRRHALPPVPKPTSTAAQMRPGRLKPSLPFHPCFLRFPLPSIRKLLKLGCWLVVCRSSSSSSMLSSDNPALDCNWRNRCRVHTSPTSELREKLQDMVKRNGYMHFGAHVVAASQGGFTALTHGHRCGGDSQLCAPRALAPKPTSRICRNAGS